MSLVLGSFVGILFGQTDDSEMSTATTRIARAVLCWTLLSLVNGFSSAPRAGLLYVVDFVFLTLDALYLGLGKLSGGSFVYKKFQLHLLRDRSQSK